LEQTEFIEKEVGEEVLKKEISHFENLIQSLSSILLLPRNKGAHHIQTMFGPKLEKSSASLIPSPVQKSKDLLPDTQQKSLPSKPLKPSKPSKSSKPTKYLSSPTILCQSSSIPKSSKTSKDPNCSENPQTIQTSEAKPLPFNNELILKLEIIGIEGYSSQLSNGNIESFLISRFERYK
jgi:hypothetical protein